MGTTVSGSSDTAASDGVGDLSGISGSFRQVDVTFDADQWISNHVMA